MKGVRTPLSHIGKLLGFFLRCEPSDFDVFGPLAFEDPRCRKQESAHAFLISLKLA
jgi:hypothetical protein